MKKKYKIIHILCHSFENDSFLDYFIYGNFAARLARNINNFSNEYQNEAWYAIRHLRNKKTFKKDGIVYKLFPAKTFYQPLESYFGLIKCTQLFNELKLEDQNRTIIHIQGERGSILHKILTDFPQFKVTIQYHGYGQPTWLDWFERLFITPIEKKNFKNASHFFVNIKPRLSYLRNIVGIAPHKISYQNVGIDFKLFKPRNREWARKKLKLPLRSFIILHIGNLTSHKGVYKIIKAYQILKKIYPHIFLLFIGADQSHPLYKLASRVASKLIGKISYKKLPFYYNAANVYCYYGNNKNIKYQGIGTAPIEALASNLNVVSTNLVHFPDNIMNKVGFIPSNFNDFVNQIEYLINHPQYKFNARRIIAKYTDYKYQTAHLLNIYEKLLKKRN